MNALRLLALVTTLAVLAGCDKPADTKPAAGTPAEKEYDIKGNVVDVAGDMKAVTLDHEEIPGLMKAMTMKYAVEDHKILEGIAAGDNVTGRLRAKDGNYTLTRLEKR